MGLGETLFSEKVTPLCCAIGLVGAPGFAGVCNDERILSGARTSLFSPALCVQACAIDSPFLWVSFVSFPRAFEIARPLVG